MEGREHRDAVVVAEDGVRAEARLLNPDRAGPAWRQPDVLIAGLIPEAAIRPPGDRKPRQLRDFRRVTVSTDDQPAPDSSVLATDLRDDTGHSPVAVGGQLAHLGARH